MPTLSIRADGKRVATFTASETWTPPPGLVSVVVECWGGGAFGGAALTVNNGGGGGGGAYARGAQTLTGASVAIQIGLEQDTFFGSAASVMAKAGLRGGSASALGHGAGGAGGTAAASVGTTKFSGANGLDGSAAVGGGGAGAGGNASGSTGGVGDATNSSGANSGAGGTGGAANVSGLTPGGGSGGATALGSQQPPGAGRVTVTYTEPGLILAALNPPASPAYSAAVLADNPVSYYRLGETSGTVAADEKGLNPGTYSGGYTLGTPGPLVGDGNRAVTFDGSTAKVEMVDSPSLRLGIPVSYEAWVKPTNFADYRTIINNRGLAVWWMIWITNTAVTGRPTLWINAGDVAATANTVLPLGVWSHVAVTYDGANARFYLNGVPDGVAAVTVVPNATAGATLIGHRPDATLQSFLGPLDEVAIYSSVLSPARILAHYNAGITTPSAGNYASEALAEQRTTAALATTAAAETKTDGGSATLALALGDAEALADARALIVAATLEDAEALAAAQTTSLAMALEDAETLIDLGMFPILLSLAAAEAKADAGLTAILSAFAGADALAEAQLLAAALALAGIEAKAEASVLGAALSLADAAALGQDGMVAAFLPLAASVALGDSGLAAALAVLAAAEAVAESRLLAVAAALAQAESLLEAGAFPAALSLADSEALAQDGSVAAAMAMAATVALGDTGLAAILLALAAAETLAEAQLLAVALTAGQSAALMEAGIFAAAVALAGAEALAQTDVLAGLFASVAAEALATAGDLPLVLAVSDVASFVDLGLLAAALVPTANWKLIASGLNGVAYDQAGNATIAGAEVLIFRDDTNAVMFQLTSDAVGAWGVEASPALTYWISYHSLQGAGAADNLFARTDKGIVTSDTIIATGT